MTSVYKTRFIIAHKAVLEVHDLGDGNFVQVGAIIPCEPANVFETRFDAMYAYVVNRLQTGTPLSNYKSSKYYNDYIDKLKIEHPEYIV